MFDIGFWELFVVLIIALLVIGPERLPALARKTGLWVRKIRGFVSSVKEDIDREFATEELKRIVKEQAESSGIHEIIEETRTTLKETENQFILDDLADADKPDKSDKPHTPAGKPGQTGSERPAKEQITDQAVVPGPDTVTETSADHVKSKQS